MGVGEFLFQRADAIRRARQGNDTKSFCREAPDNRGTRAGTDTRDDGNRLVRHRRLAGTCIAATGFWTALADQTLGFDCAILDDYHHITQPYSVWACSCGAPNGL